MTQRYIFQLKIHITLLKQCVNCRKIIIFERSKCNKENKALNRIKVMLAERIIKI